MPLPRAFSGVAVAMLAAALASGCGSNSHTSIGTPHIDAGDSGPDGSAGNDGAAGGGGAAGTAGTGGTAGTAATDAGGAGGADAGCPANGVMCGGQCCVYANATATCSNGACAMGACDAGYADCNADPTDGCEVPVDSDTDNCGSCGNACVTPHATAACTSGVCGIASCDTGYSDCNNDPTDGCEADTNNDPANCGACSNVCPATGGAPVCNSGTCGISACPSGTGECDGDPSTVCETNLLTDLSNCGYCGNACNLPNAGSTCSTGQCTITSCDSGYADCDTLPANGCEVNLASSVNNCGACGDACTNANGQTACVNAACSPTCNTGYGDCDGDATNGCETDTATDPLNCGTCGHVCNSTNGTPSCVAGACKIACAAGWGDCDGDPSNGCETKLDTSTNCGACGTSCNPANATGSCSTGSCKVVSCNSGYADCNSDPSDGCEVNTQSDASNCSACGTACSCPNGTASCVSGVCGCSSCASGTADCDGSTANGCEINTNTDVNNCGGCGTVCNSTNGTPICSGGTCSITCSSGFGDCNNSVTDGCETSLTTNTNCGACGGSCNPTNGTGSCSTGACTVVACSGGYADCNGSASDGCEVNIASDPTHCGSCGKTCSSAGGTATCTSGICGIVCSNGYADCNSDPSDGCETSLTTTSNCGACGTTCSNANGSTTCSSGACSPICNSGYGDCDSNPDNGCETNLNQNVNDCGACGTVCSCPNGRTPNCLNGSCGCSACSAGTADCDGNSSNGCETNTNTDVNNCGGCGAVCDSTNGTPSCSGGACSIACNSGYADCNSSAADGCETSLTTLTDCGSCGTSCSRNNATATCSTGACKISTCNSGYSNCDGNDANGCETSTNTNVNNCGGCNNVCSCPNGTPSCVNGACGCSACNAGTADCDGQVSNGCEVNTNTDATNCGGCGKVCNSTNGTPSCSGGSCSISCNSGYGDCNNSALDGCETQLNTLTNCGACGTSCSRTNATATCTTGSCQIASCNAGYGNCDGNNANGCETNTNTSASNCGGCGNVCNSTHGTASCSGGSCAIACSSGYGDCNNSAADGCEVQLNTNTNCGACGTACSLPHSTTSCSTGSCQFVSCSSGYGDCNNNTADGCEASLSTTTNCGACGTSCSNAHGTTTCSSGTCAPTCSSGYGDCNSNPDDGCEKSLTTLTDCGSCGTSCSLSNATASCSTGTCAVSACNSGYANCNGTNSDGCEVHTQTDVNNCGACGSQCSSNNGTPSCSLGACGIACNANWGNCDGDAKTNGCETDLLTSQNNCGACGHACTASQTCVNGACQSSGAVCGDGVVQTGEQCDDGNTLNLDGCSSTCKYEQVQRITNLTVMRGTAPGYCTPTTNQFGKALTSSAASSFNSSLQTDVDNGVLDTMFDFQNLDDLTGQNDASLSVGVVNGSLDARAGTWTAPGAIDWWFLANASDVDSSGLPVFQLSPAAISSYVLTGGPNKIVMQYSQWPLTMLDANLKANIGTSPAPNQPAPPPQASQLASGLVTFQTMNAASSGLGLCGNVTVGSLAAVPAPQQICNGGSNACDEGYTYCSSGTVTSTCNSLLDVLVNGCKVYGFITVIHKTQPDVGVGGNPPNSLTASGTYHKVTVSQPNDAYSAYFQFQSQRAHITNNLP